MLFLLVLFVLLIGSSTAVKQPVSLSVGLSSLCFFFFQKLVLITLKSYHYKAFFTNIHHTVAFILKKKKLLPPCAINRSIFDSYLTSYRCVL